MGCCRCVTFTWNPMTNKNQNPDIPSQRFRNEFYVLRRGPTQRNVAGKVLK